MFNTHLDFPEGEEGAFSGYGKKIKSTKDPFSFVGAAKDGISYETVYFHALICLIETGMINVRLDNRIVTF